MDNAIKLYGVIITTFWIQSQASPLFIVLCDILLGLSVGGDVQ